MDAQGADRENQISGKCCGTHLATREMLRLAKRAKHQFTRRIEFAIALCP